ncbi:hypothetical protein JNX11_RS28600, partial [Escherichia coli]|nr:hypothetical protein [Escherichia coli]
YLPIIAPPLPIIHVIFGVAVVNTVFPLFTLLARLVEILFDIETDVLTDLLVLNDLEALKDADALTLVETDLEALKLAEVEADLDELNDKDVEALKLAEVEADFEALMLAD